MHFILLYENICCVYLCDSVCVLRYYDLLRISHPVSHLLFLIHSTNAPPSPAAPAAFRGADKSQDGILDFYELLAARLKGVNGVVENPRQTLTDHDLH